LEQSKQVKQIHKHNLLTREEEVKLLNKIKNSKNKKDKLEAKNELIEKNMKLVSKIANKYKNENGIEYDDLFQQGALGLIEAIDKFKIKKGYRFSTYAIWWIRQKITRYIAKQGTVTYSIPKKEIKMKIKKLQEYLAKKLKREPTIKELSEFTQFNEKTVAETVENMDISTSLDMNLNEKESDNTTRYNFIENDKTTLPFREALNKVIKKEIDNCLDYLTKRKAKILDLRYGLTDGRKRTFKEVAKHFDVTRQRIEQLEKEALRDLKARYRVSGKYSEIKDLCSK